MSLLHTPALETLIVNRYIDAEIDFYELAEDYMDNLTRANARIIDWPSRPSSIEPWFIREDKIFQPVIKKFRKKVIEHKKVLETIS